ncbi:MAG: Leucine-tRNA ligase [Candidatus Daviesbacteria bacterium GW2011_GWA2_38_24]|uniref:Leucine--tRNA ligase n=1 Tax=Candidatus Daviesbacteria bacterium GW2011_GWA2_38_24 TaxID=1618422 RepID=A0A0G0JG93_9BACT|nr:MAG: Leucine-tRNA ligase [Candidatus Daviesbacteria bacterium GW2011_GWA2_38_24]OGE22625.1 MAG: leucine--tRNA ligase [Candidatus Daviesbacteria bacterium RIFCSPHIGHO2_01_FULL_38_8]
MKKYIPHEIEQKWQQKWAEIGLYESKIDRHAIARDDKRKYYVLAEFSYPSGDLHMGHWFTWGGADIFARFKRLQGYNVFFPNGFDAFGLPAENAAIKRGIHPRDWTYDNIERMKKQYSTMGASFSFDHQVVTCDSNYYKWNQWYFLRMFEKGLAYRGEYMSNWCESCQTVLANEGVEAGKCWRCGTEVVQKAVKQWFFKITEYADRLIWPEPDPKTGLSNGVDWPQSVREGQNAWIGRSAGLQIEFKVQSSKFKIEVFTSYPETIYGVTYLVLAPEHPLVEKITTPEQLEDVKNYTKQAQKKLEQERKALDKEKTGVFTGVYAINPVNGEKMPVWVADYVLATYGTGAVMGVPGSDLRDYAFAKTYSLPISKVIGSSANDISAIETEADVLFSGVMVNSGQFSGLATPDPAREKIMDYLEEEGWGRRKVEYHLHDWSVSRQRYWGAPVPIIHCDPPAGGCGVVPVPYEDLPVELPYEVDYTPKGKAPLATNEEWLNVKCPKCKGSAKRDPETLDTFVDSSWYFFRYLNPDLENAPFDIETARKIMPVDIYFGGAEHTLGHTLYSRFFTKFTKDLGMIDFDEYALRRINHGIVLGPDGNKMSKSIGNVVNPDEEVKKFGADATRVYLAFFMPYEGTGPWVSERIWGTYRFIERVWEMFERVSLDDRGSMIEGSALKMEHREVDTESLYQMHRTIKKVTEDIENIRFNTAVASLMEWLNYLTSKGKGERGKGKVTVEEYKTFLILLAPFAPHVTEELWQTVILNEVKDLDSSSDGHRTQNDRFNSIHNQAWSVYEEKYLVQAQVKIPVQVNGKLRDFLIVDSSLLENQKEIEERAFASEKIKKYLNGNNPKKTIYIPGKMLSIVT